MSFGDPNMQARLGWGESDVLYETGKITSSATPRADITQSCPFRIGISSFESKILAVTAF